MKFKSKTSLLLMIGTAALMSCKDGKTKDEKSLDQAPASSQQTTEPKIHEETVTYTANGTTLKGFVAYDENKKGVRPAVLVVHEWWGLNDYVRNRAKKLA